MVGVDYCFLVCLVVKGLSTVLYMKHFSCFLFFRGLWVSLSKEYEPSVDFEFYSTDEIVREALKVCIDKL